MEEKIFQELRDIFSACRGRENRMKEDDQSFFTSLSNKFTTFGRDLELSTEQVDRLRVIYRECGIK